MKTQLKKCKKGDLKQFGYGSILVSFFLERVANLFLQVEWGIPVLWDPRMKRWCDLMAWHVVGPIVKYTDVFFDWLRPHLLMLDDYAYDRLDFRGDPNLVLLEGFQWGDSGKKYILFLWCFLWILKYKMFFILSIQRLINFFWQCRCRSAPSSGYIPY